MRTVLVVVIFAVACVDPNTQDAITTDEQNLAGSGSANALAVWTDPSTIGTSSVLISPSTGQLGLNSHTPSAVNGGMIENVYNTNAKHILSTQYFTGQSEGKVDFQRCRGSSVAPSPLVANDWVFSLRGLGCDSTNVMKAAAEIRVSTDSPTNTGSISSRLGVFLGRGDGTYPERWRVDHLGHLASISQKLAASATTPYVTVVTGCGTAPALTLGGDNTGKLTIGAGDTGCTITFSGTGWAGSQLGQNPICLMNVADCTPQLAPGAGGYVPCVPSFHQGQTKIVIADPTGALAGHVIQWHCFGSA